MMLMVVIVMMVLVVMITMIVPTSSEYLATRSTAVGSPLLLGSKPPSTRCLDFF